MKNTLKRVLFASAWLLSVWGAAFGGYTWGVLVADSNPQIATEDPRGPFTRDNILIRFNEYRIEKGLPTLPENEVTLDPVAQERAEQIFLQAQNGGTATHDGFRAMRQSGKIPPEVGEIIACGYPTATATVEGWKESPTHNDILTDSRLDSIGIGIKESCVSVLVHSSE